MQGSSPRIGVIWMKLIGKCISGFIRWLIKDVFRFM